MNKVLKFIFWALTLGVMCMIFYFSSQIASVSSGMSDGVIFRLLSAFYPGFDNMTAAARFELADSLVFAVRKSAHFLIYTLLGIFSCSAFCCYKINMKVRFFLATGLCVLYAVSDEIHQLFVEGRSCELRDVLIDSAGSVLGILIILIIVNLFIKKRKVMIK